MSLIDKISPKIDPWSRLEVVQPESVFAYGNSRRVSLLQDWEASRGGSGQIDASDGMLRVQTGATADSHYRYETVDFGDYQTGMSVEGSIGAWLRAVESDEYDVRLGAGVKALESNTECNSAYFRFRQGGQISIVITIGCETFEIEQNDWNVDKATGKGRFRGNPSGEKLDPSRAPLIYSIEMTWYAAGPITFSYYTVSDAPSRLIMRRVPVHVYVPEDWKPFQNPSLPLMAYAENGPGGGNVDLRVSGRRWEIKGRREPTTREIGGYASGRDVAASQLAPIVAIQTDGNGLNGGPSTTKNFVTSFSGSSNRDGLFALYSADRDNVTGTFGSFEGVPDGQTSLRLSSDISALGDGAQRISQWQLVEAGQGASSFASIDATGRRLPIIRSRPTVLVFQNLEDNKAVVTGALGVEESAS